MDARELARWLRIVSSNRLVNPDPVTWANTGRGGYCFSLDFCTDAEVLAGRIDAVSDVNWPREVARFILAGVWSYRQAEPASGFVGPGQRRQDTTATATATATARLSDMLTLPAARSGACPLFVELCAGLASVSLVLQGGRHARPPVSRMGNKRGYAEAILWACGLRQGQGAHRFLWCEPDPGCSALLRAYGQPEVLREAAEIIRGWADEDPRELWERLKAEGPIRSGEADEVARGLLTAAWGGHRQDLSVGRSAGFMGPRPELNDGDNKGITATGLASKVDTSPTFPAITVAPDAREIDPREVARWSFVHQGSFQNKGPDAGIGRPQGKPGGDGFGAKRPLTEEIPDSLARCPTFPAITVSPDAREIDPPALPAGSVVFIDPPYVGTTGYGHDLPRAAVVEMARRWKDAGALVCISEQEALPELMAEGWHALDITSTRKGQKRTFSKQQAEWLTMSEAPRWRPAVQVGLFG